MSAKIQWHFMGQDHRISKQVLGFKTIRKIEMAYPKRREQEASAFD